MHRQFRHDLLSFLGIINDNQTTTTAATVNNNNNNNIIEAFQLGRENVNRFTTADQAHDETIRLCPSRKDDNDNNNNNHDENNENKSSKSKKAIVTMPDDLRLRFLAESRQTAEWIQKRLLLSSSSFSSSSLQQQQQTTRAAAARLVVVGD